MIMFLLLPLVFFLLHLTYNYSEPEYLPFSINEILFFKYMLWWYSLLLVADKEKDSATYGTIDESGPETSDGEPW